ncbi:unnamed protein product [Closterium sp. NIES-53]
MSCALGTRRFLLIVRPWRAAVSACRTPRARGGFCPSRALGVRQFLPVARPQHATLFCPSLAPSVRQFSARRAGAPLPCFPSSPPPASSSLSYFACSSLGGGGGCWEDAGLAVGGGCTSSAPLLCFVTKPATPPPPPLLSPPAAPTAAAVSAWRLVRLCLAPRAPCPPAPAPPDRTPRSPLPSIPSPNCVCSNLGGGGGGVRGRWHQQHHPPLLSFTATPAAVGGEGGEGGVVGVTGGAAAAAARLPLCLRGGGGFNDVSPVDHVPPNRRSTLPIYLGVSRETSQTSSYGQPGQPGNHVDQMCHPRPVDRPGRRPPHVDLTWSTTPLVDQLHVDNPPGRPTPGRPVHMSPDHTQSASPGQRHPNRRPPLVDLPSRPAEVGALSKSAPLQWPLCRSTRPVDQLAHCCRSAAILTPDPEVGSAQARTGPTTTPVDTPLPRSRLGPPAQTAALLGE